MDCLRRRKNKLMKKLTILLLTVLTIFSCGDELEYNTPAFQGNRDYGLWMAEFTNASIDNNGVLTITGSNNVETVELILPTIAVDSFVLGNVNSREARYIDANGKVFSTNNDPDPSVSIYEDLGYVVIDEIFNSSFSGRFQFLAYDEEGLNSVGYNEGIFFRVPLVSGSIPSGEITCLEAQALSITALNTYESTFSGGLEYIDNSAYVTACNAYVDALIDQINICDDPDGSIQMLIDDLNNCIFPCEYAEQNSATAQQAFEDATIGNYIEACETYTFYLQQQIDFCGDEDGSIQVIIDGLNCSDDDGDGIPNIFEDFDGDMNLDNDDTDGDTIPNYLDDDDDGDGILTIFETKDEDGNPVDTDGDMDVDYLDSDDDGDGTSTSNENADPNMDGNPDDAVDTDGDGTPDYLDAT